MKRKVIEQGNGTLTITLPKQWTKNVGLKGGDEIEVVEKGKELSILTKGDKEISKVSIDLRNVRSATAAKWVLSAMHKSGYDEIEVFYDDNATLKAIHGEVKDTFVGFAIMEQSKQRVLIRSVSKDSYSEFERSLRRAFQVTLALADSISERIKSKDFEHIMELVSLEKSNNQFTNFCERMLVKEGYEFPEKTCFKYIVVWNIEKVCDFYKDICKYIDEMKIDNLSPDISKFYNEVSLFFRNFYNLIYKFDLNELGKLVEEGKRLSSKIKNYKPKKDYEYKLVHILDEIVSQTMMFSGAVVALNS